MNLLGLLPHDLVAALPGVRLPEARQVLARIISEGGNDPTPRRAPRRGTVAAVRKHTTWNRLEVRERVTDDDGKAVRYLFRSPDGALSEAVRIGLHKPDCFTVCLSSQVGCAMGCVFCATGRLGLTRDLEPWEMVSAFLTVRDEAPGRVTGVVFMGQGEPFHNYDNVMQAAAVLCDPCGGRVAKENITISTVGLVPQIRRFTRENQPYRLIVSLHSAIPEKRASIAPRIDLAELRAALAERRGRATIAWVVLGGINTGPDEIVALGDWLGDLPIRLNLIDVNDIRPDGFPRASPTELRVFLDRVQVLGIPVVRRYSAGRETHAACGMLAGRSAAET